MDITPLEAFLAEAEERGHIEQTELDQFVVDHELDEDAVESLRAALAERGVEVHEEEEEVAPALDLEAAPSGTTDSLGLFLAEIGRYGLLTAAEEVTLAKRVERGDLAA
jgi:RNA polymerase primary sigma factor